MKSEIPVSQHGGLVFVNSRFYSTKVKVATGLAEKLFEATLEELTEWKSTSLER